MAASVPQQLQPVYTRAAQHVVHTCAPVPDSVTTCADQLLPPHTMTVVVLL